MPKLTAAVAREFLDYDPDTGKLWWKVRDAKWFSTPGRATGWNKQFAGKEAFTAQTGGYFVGRIFDTAYKAHRVIWLMQTGDWPDEIDHVDQDRGNNRWSNLRSTTHQKNCENWPNHPANAVGCSGVTFHKGTGKWRVRLRDRHIGVFDTVPEAIAARKAAELEEGYNYHG